VVLEKPGGTSQKQGSIRESETAPAAKTAPFTLRGESIASVGPNPGPEPPGEGVMELKDNVFEDGGGHAKK